jgi:hypothetical protein
MMGDSCFIITDSGKFLGLSYMINQNIYFACAAMFLFASVIDGSQKGNILPVIPAKSDILKDTVKDTVAVPQAPQELMTVSPRILYGAWHGKDTLGHEVSFNFTKPAEGVAAIFCVAVQVGKLSVSGVCSDWENNMCNLMVETKDLQNILSRWFFKYDGTWLTIEIGDNQRIAGSGIFMVKQTERR